MIFQESLPYSAIFQKVLRFATNEHISVWAGEGRMEENCNELGTVGVLKSMVQIHVC